MTQRDEHLPDEQAALKAMVEAYDRLRRLGWREAIYSPKDGSAFEAIEAGSTGIHRCRYQGEWPNGQWWIEDDDTILPAHPILFRLYPADEAKRQAAEAAARSRAEREAE